jgi:hypothetical protein
MTYALSVWMITGSDLSKARSNSKTARNSMRLLVVCVAAAADPSRPSSVTHALPPGPGLPRQEPSVAATTAITAMLDEKQWPRTARKGPGQGSPQTFRPPLPAPDHRDPWNGFASTLRSGADAHWRPAPQAGQAPLRSVRTGSVSQRSSTGVSGHQRSPRVQRNRRSLALQVTQLG